MSILITILTHAVLIALSIAFCSCFEWLLHNFVMHKKPFGFSYAFNAHQEVHHERFDWKDGYHLESNGDERTIPMAWWNGPILIVLATVIPFLISYVLSFWQLCIIFAIIVTLYYASYEYIHWCMHLPKDRWFEKTWVFKFLDNHHRIHHLKMNCNLNVVCPIADLITGTLVLKSPKEFPPRSEASIFQGKSKHRCPWFREA